METQQTSFYTHHSAWGSYASFVLGKYQRGGGFALSGVQAPDMNVYIGYRQEGERVRMLPFYTDHRIGIGVENYHAPEQFEDTSWRKTQVDVFEPDEIHREINWCSEIWTAGILSFSLFTPFFNVKPPEKMDLDESRKYTAPLVMARLTIDNSIGETTTRAVFGLQGLRRSISYATGSMLRGAALDTRYGLACKAADGVEELICWDLIETAFYKGKAHLLGNEAGLLFSVPAGERRFYDIVLGTYQDGIITSNIPAKLYYTNFFSNLEDVLEYGVEYGGQFMETARQRDQMLKESGMNASRSFLLAHATRSYLANSELLADNKGNVIFIVNEGEYQMMNTLDLIVDQAFWELRYTPWTVKNELDFFADYYYYHDSVKTISGLEEGGISFCHDVGVANMFAPYHSSSYEIPEQSHTFSFMTYEELLNWILTASLYVTATNDKKWLQEKRELLEEIIISLIRRDSDGDGVMDSDSSRCMDGFEISTYDSLDQSLSQARNNLYLAVKAWAAWLCIGKLAEMIGWDASRIRAEEMAGRCAHTISENFNSEEEYIPAIFENSNQSRIIPAVEGLIYPYFAGDYDAVSDTGRFAEFITLLKRHITCILAPGVCIDEVSGGWKLSSTSENTWMSKIFLNQYICEQILGLSLPGLDASDAVHAQWQRIACADTAATDQVDSRSGKPLGSRLYPRLVTAVLWLEK